MYMPETKFIYKHVQAWSWSHPCTKIETSSLIGAVYSNTILLLLLLLLYH